MSDWRTHADNGDWQLILWAGLSKREMRALYHRLCLVVPKMWRENGLERHFDYKLPQDLPKGQLQFAAQWLNEMRDQFEDDPKWSTIAETYAHDVLEELGKPTKTANGTARKADEADYFSQEWHALRVLEMVDGSKFTLAVAEKLARQKPLDASEVLSWMDEIAETAFAAGRHMHAAWGKGFEHHAVRGIKIATATSSGGAEKARSFEKTKNEIISAMGELVDGGMSARSAADAVFRRQLGASANANYQLWKRDKRDSLKK